MSSGSCQSSGSSGSSGSYLNYEKLAEKVQPGDMIEIRRSRLIKHWVLCERVQVDVDGTTVWCFHITADANINEMLDGGAVIRYEPLDEILVTGRGSNEHHSPCRINNQESRAIEFGQELEKEGLKPLSLDQVFKELHNLVDSRVRYDLRSSNCEHHCTLWKYGIGWSDQVKETDKRLKWGQYATYYLSFFWTWLLVSFATSTVLRAMVNYHGFILRKMTVLQSTGPLEYVFTCNMTSLNDEERGSEDERPDVVQ